MHRPSPRRPSPRLLTPKSLLTLLTFLCLSLSLYTFFTLHASPPSTLTAAEITSKNLRIYDKSKHTFSLQPYSKTTCIATLVSNDDEDIDDLRIALKSLNNLNLDSKTKIIIFYESDLTMSHTNKITKSLPSHHIDFEYINFQTFPEQFNPSVEDSNWHKRSKWGYHQMIRFWITRVWDFESVRENCDSLMRVDSDSCFLPSTKEEMGLEEGIVYRANIIKKDCEQYADGLWDLAKSYVAEKKIRIKNPHLWEMARKFWEEKDNKLHKRCLPTFYNNYEISSLNFMTSPSVRAWHYHVTEEEPFGVFRRRWGDAIVRFLTVAMFAEERQVERGVVEGYEHPCGDPS